MASYCRVPVMSSGLKMTYLQNQLNELIEIYRSQLGCQGLDGVEERQLKMRE
jgi:hypothetical protein